MGQYGRGGQCGLNPQNTLQLFLSPLPRRCLQHLVVLSFASRTRTDLRGRPSRLPSDSRRRVAFSLQGAELGGGNPDFSKEVFYQLSPDVTTVSTGSISLLTGASLIPVASPTASPNPSSSPFVVPGLAAGELAIAQFTLSPGLRQRRSAIAAHPKPNAHRLTCRAKRRFNFNQRRGCRDLLGKFFVDQFCRAHRSRPEHRHGELSARY